jgi:hypothetical protein
MRRAKKTTGNSQQVRFVITWVLPKRLAQQTLRQFVQSEVSNQNKESSPTSCREQVNPGDES